MNRVRFLAGPVGGLVLGVSAAVFLGNFSASLQADSAKALVAEYCHDLLPSGANANCQDATNKQCQRCTEDAIDTLGTNSGSQTPYKEDSSPPSSWNCGDRRIY